MMKECEPFVVDGGACGQLNMAQPKKAYIHVTRCRQGQSSFKQVTICVAPSLFEETPFGSNKVRNGPVSSDQGYSTASQSSSYVQGTPYGNTPASPYPTFCASTKCIFKMDCAN